MSTRNPKKLRGQSFCAYITSCRMAENLSLRQAAARLNISAAFLCNLERGKLRLPLARYRQWARVLGADLATMCRLTTCSKCHGPLAVDRLPKETA